MAQVGEQEVFNIHLEEGKCYEHIEATRILPPNEGGEHRYFSTNVPRYVGRFVKNETIMYGGYAAERYAIFNNRLEEIRILYDNRGRTCFIEVPCTDVANVIKDKAINQALRAIIESKTKQSAGPGLGAANLIRKFAGIKVPKGAEGGRRKYKRSSKRKQSKKRKTRSRK